MEHRLQPRRLMKHVSFALLGVGLLAMQVPAWAEEATTTETRQTDVQRVQQTTPVPATPVPDTVQRTTITEKKPNEGGLRNEAVGIKPHVGILSLSNSLGNTDSRALAGLMVDVNGLRRLNMEGGRPYLGPSVGILYSHLGAAGSDFFGLNGAGGNQSGTHLLLIPFNIKAGYTVSDIFRPSIHVGGTLVYNNTQAGGLTPTGVETLGTSSTSTSSSESAATSAS